MSCTNGSVCHHSHRCRAWAYLLCLLVALAVAERGLATTCPSVGSAGSAVYRCTDSGSTSTNGTNFRDTLTAASYGDTIVLPAGVTFSTGTSSNSKFQFPVKSGSGWITVQSSRAGELPDGVRVSPSDIGKMATLEVNGGGGTAAEFPGGSHHWKFVGILFTSGSNINTVASIVNYLAADDKTTSTIGNWVHHIWFDRCVFRPYEYAAGALNPFRSVSQGVMIEGEEITVENSYMYEFGGARTDQQVRSVTGISESTTPVMTASSLNGYVDAVNTWISGATGWWSRFNGSYRCNVLTSTTCELQKSGIYIVVSGGVAKFQTYFRVPHGFQAGDVVTIGGFPGSGTGSDFNGAKTIDTVPSDYEFTFSTSESNGIYCVGGVSCQFQLSGSRFYVKLDTTGQGTLTGTVTHKTYELHNSYAIGVVAAPGPMRIRNNYLEAQYSAIFLGGGGSATRYSATMSDVAADGATFSSTVGLRVGEIVAVKTGYTGYLSGWRTVKVATVNHSTGAVTWTPWGRTALRNTDDTITSGTCNTSGTSVSPSWYVGYENVYNGVPIVINGTGYTVSFINSTSSLTLTGSAGTQTGVSCSLAMLPTEGGDARWRGLPGTTVYARQNEFTVASYGETIGGLCKGAHELKIEVGGVWNGNTYTGKGCVAWGLTQRNQTGATPWSTLGRTQFTNNLVFNTDNRIWVLLLDDELATTVREGQAPPGYGGGRLVFRNNLVLGDATNAYGNNESGYIGAITGDESVFIHNSILKPYTTVSGIVNGPTYSASSVPPYGLQTSIYDSNLYSQYGYGWNTASAFPLKTTNVKRNLIAGNATSQGTIDSDVPGNLYAANLAAIGLVGTCDNTSTNWKNCKLDSGATHAGAGENGSDPGADPVVIEDHINGWSVEAGLQALDTNTLKPQQIGSTRAAISFRLRNSTAATCTLVLYTDADYRTEHADTNTSGEKACNRSANAVDGDRVTFVLGTNTALTASTPYYFEITDGSRKMRWSFTTRAAGAASQYYRWSRAMECGTDGATFGTAVSAGTNYEVAQGAVRYCRESSPTGPTQVVTTP